MAQSSLSVTRVLWIAFMMAIVVYAALAFLVLKQMEEHAQLTWILMAFAVLSGGGLAVAFAFPWLFTRNVGTYQEHCIVRWAFVEAIGVYGVMARILGASVMVCGAFLLIGLIGLVLLPPSEEGQRAFLEQKEP